MKALVIYVTLLIIGLAVAVSTGLFVERYTSSGVSLLVFLLMFFANYAVAWMITLLIMDGTLRSTPAKADRPRADAEDRAYGSAHGARDLAGQQG